MKASTWQELEEVIGEDRCSEFLRTTPKKYRKAMALALAIARWRPERKGGLRGDGQNALCIYDSELSNNDLHCPYCPLKTEGQYCAYPTSIYQKWRKHHNAWAQRDEAADEMYNLLCKLYAKEYAKC